MEKISAVDALAKHIREIDGTHTMGTGRLAEEIIAFLRRNPEIFEVPGADVVDLAPLYIGAICKQYGTGPEKEIRVPRHLLVACRGVVYKFEDLIRDEIVFGIEYDDEIGVR